LLRISSHASRPRPTLSGEPARPTSERNSTPQFSHVHPSGGSSSRKNHWLGPLRRVSRAIVCAHRPRDHLDPRQVLATITLKPGAYLKATGSSQYQSQGSQRELQVEVEHLKSLTGQHVNIFVNGNKWASPRVSSLGIAQVDRNTDAGQTVPSIGHGSTVRVRTTSGTLIAGGTY